MEKVIVADDLVNVNVDVNKELLDQLAEKDKRIAELSLINSELMAFTYVASHDLQEPLRKIRMFSDLLLGKEAHKLSAEGVNYFHRIQMAAQKMQQLIDDLLTYSRLDANDPDFQPTPLRTIIDEATADLREIIEDEKAVIEVSGQCIAHVITFQFRQLMNNLISNALKFSRPGIAPHIIINCRTIGSGEIAAPGLQPGKAYCHVSVADNGIGFDPVYKDRIFEVFQRLHGHEEYKGTGIGLSIVKKIVDYHNGAITATGETNKGATFDIYLPAVG